jgi:hypothetical protein
LGSARILRAVAGILPGTGSGGKVGEGVAVTLRSRSLAASNLNGSRKSGDSRRTPKATASPGGGCSLRLDGQESFDVAGSVVSCGIGPSAAWMRSIFGVRARIAALAALVMCCNLGASSGGRGVCAVGSRSVALGALGKAAEWSWFLLTGRGTGQIRGRATEPAEADDYFAGCREWGDGGWRLG